MPLAGQTVQGIHLVRPLGSGSHSVVYAAVSGSGQPCTVKVFRPDMHAHAQREFRVAHPFSHPHVVRAYQALLVGGAPALLMDYARGRTLFDRFAPQPLAGDQAAAFLQAVCGVLGALEYMHGLGLVHRDVKPENILVEAGGTAAWWTMTSQAQPARSLEARCR
ncbi:protein kinase [Deinococcus lacus]|uniref:Protein kinase n=1 Tax=Deinococcus lacus TaxID=392561 RepID=A0ABW1Y912_9DEIO